MKTLSICLAITIVLLCPYAPAQWVKTNGPINGNIGCLAVSGTNLFAGTGGSVFRSTDNGTSWTAASTGLPTTQTVNALVVSGTNLLAGGGGGVFLSTDNGTNWGAASAGLTAEGGVTSLFVSGANLFAGTSVGVFRSTNGGTSWTNSGLTNTVVRYFAVCGTNLFAGGGGGVFLSTNNGTSWTATNGFSMDKASVVALAMCGTNLFVAYTTSWYTGVVLSSDNGWSWNSLDVGLTNTQVHAFAVSGANLFAGTWSGVFLSTDNLKWTAVSTGLTDTLVNAIAVNGTNLFAGTYISGVWRRPLSEMITSTPATSSQIPKAFELCQNYPNPFNPSTTIKFELPMTSQVNLSVYDLLAREVSVLVNERRGAGVHEVKFDGSNLASGVYFYRLQAGDFVSTKQLVFLK
jgi:hypothetical protein